MNGDASAAYDIEPGQDREGIRLHGDRAAEILSLVRADWERSTQL